MNLLLHALFPELLSVHPFLLDSANTSLKVMKSENVIRTVVFLTSLFSPNLYIQMHSSSF